MLDMVGRLNGSRQAMLSLRLLNGSLIDWTASGVCWNAWNRDQVSLDGLELS